MIISFLIAAIFIASLMQPSAQRLYAASIFAAATLLHDVLFGNLDGIAYYSSAALFDLIVITLISGISQAPQLAISLVRLSMLSIIVNFSGWAAWYSYLSPLGYNFAFIGIYLCALVQITKGIGAENGRGFTLDSWGSCFCFNRDSGPNYNYQNDKQV